MKDLRSWIAIIGILVALLLIAEGMAHFSRPYADIEYRQSYPSVPAAEVPQGWYSHDIRPVDAPVTLLKYVVLTKNEDLPKRLPSDGQYDNPQILVSISKIDVSPREKMQEYGVMGPDGQPIYPDARWSTYKGRSLFTFTDQLGAEVTILFGEDTMYEFIFGGGSPDRTDFWKVISYYAEDPAVPVISRSLTLITCKALDLPRGQQYDMQVDSETGYVTIGYRANSSPSVRTPATFAFLNYNDDLSQCTSSVRALLERAK